MVAPGGKIAYTYDLLRRQAGGVVGLEVADGAIQMDAAAQR